jgi:hypothetical protein
MDEEVDDQVIFKSKEDPSKLLEKVKVQDKEI